MSTITPLPVFEADADPANRDGLTDQEIYDRLESPETIVVRFGYMKLVGEFKYGGDARPGCGSKLVARTPRGTELVEMLTTTCENAGCGKSVTRNEMLEYIENSGGKDYPFYTNGRILRVATIEDLNGQSGLESVKQEAIKASKKLIYEMKLPMKLVEAEPILGGELMTFYYMSEERVDFRELVKELAAQFKTRIEMRQVGARDEARLVADYERCGQHCCCKNFLKVLQPVSMRSAKQQKATLEPLKISGRCGRLMCCLRYEDQTYRELKKNLPRRKSRVGTSEGPGIVLDSKLLVQLVLVKLEHDGREIAVPVEELMDPEKCPKPGDVKPEADPLRGMSTKEVEDRTSRRGRKQRGKSKDAQQDEYRAKSREEKSDDDKRDGDKQSGRKKRRRRGGRGRKKQTQGGDGAPQQQQSQQSTGDENSSGGGKKSRRRGRRGGRRRRGKGGGNQGGDNTKNSGDNV